MNATGSGTSWGDASGDLQKALTDASEGTEIWIAEGVYYPVKCNPCSEKDRSVSFVIPDGVKVFGGFKGKEKHNVQRKWQKYLTRLSGDIGMSGPQDNSYSVVSINAVNNPTILDGLIISHGNANADVPLRHPHRSGGGLYYDGSGEYRSTHPSLVNCLFMNNFAMEGGAVYNNGYNGDASPTVIDCTFTNNKAKHGGGIFNDGELGISNPNITYSQFVSNDADYGPGIFSIYTNKETTLKIFNSSFANNRAGNGGCLFYFGLSAGPKLRTVLFVNNISGNDREEDVTVRTGTGDGDDWMVETYLDRE